MKKIKAILILQFLVTMVYAQTDSDVKIPNLEWRSYLSKTDATFEDITNSFDEYWKDKPYQKGKGYKQFKRWEDFMAPRVYPSGDLTLPSSNYQNFNEWQNNNDSYSTPSTSNWTSLGPFTKPTGSDTGVGRLNMLRFDPNNTDIMYVGAPDGGLWKSTNGGTSWETMTDFLGVIGVSDLAIDPNNTDIMYLATGDIEGDRRSIGVLKSEDGGSTWNTTGLEWSATDNYRISKMLMDPTDPMTLLVSTDGGVFKTTDGGANWSPPGDDYVKDFKDMEFKPGDPNTVYAAGTEFWKSTDKGDTWVQITNGLPDGEDVARIALGVSAANPDYVYVLAGKSSDLGFLGLYLSEDSGDSFATRSTSPNILGFTIEGDDEGGQANYDLTIAVAPDDADAVTIGGINLWQSSDAGESWFLLTFWDPDPDFQFVHADIHEVSYMPGNATTIFACNDGGISKSEDDGQTWTDISNNLNISQQYALGISSLSETGLVAGLQDIGSIYSDGSWKVVAGGDGGDCFIDRTNNDNIVVSTTNGAHALSTDGGQTFNDILSGIPSGSGNADFFSAIIQDPVEAARFYAGGRDQLYVTDNMGTSWQSTGDFPFNGNHVKRMAVAPSNNSVIYALEEQNIVRSDNQGATWTNINGNLPIDLAGLSNLTVSNTNENKLWVVFSGYADNTKVFKSDDGGSTWMNISSGLPNLPGNTIVFQNDSPKEDIYVGMDIGVFHANNDADAWSPFMTDLPHVSIRDLRIFYGGNKIKAGTYGRGAWEADLLNTQVSTDKDWTLLVYLVGSDLESGSDAGSTDMEEMIAADMTDYVNVIVLRGGSNKEGWDQPKTYLITAGEKTELDFVPSSTDMANSNNITEFINWATTTYPAQKFMMDFWNHGGDIRGYGNDEVSGNNLKVQGIKKAIGDSEFIKNGTRFEILGFDACLMATLEVQTSLKDFSNYFVGSEETEPGHGWNYTPIINAMESGDALTGDKIGKVIVDSYKAQSEAEETSNVTLGVMNLAYIPYLEDKLTTLFMKMKDDDKLRTLQRARGKAEEYSKSIQNPEYSEDMVDIGDMMKMLKKIDPSLSPEVDSVLVALDSTVVYNRKDDTRPLATGISMYLPHNVLVDEGETGYLIDSIYLPIGFDSTLSDFIANTYIPSALSDNSAPSGMTDPDFTFSGLKGSSSTRNYNSDSISAIIIAHDDDLEQVQVVLIEEFEGFPNEYIFLGASFPDTIVMNDDGTETYAYKWDGAWLGINGYPAYISDIQDYEIEDENGDFEYRTRVHIPAILNPNTENERDIIISYSYDEEFNITLESIVPEVYGEDRIVPKERLQLVPGDQVQLLYESFNEVTDEEFFVVDDDAVFTIVNGNGDLMLEYDELFEGNYKLGYILMDHSQNDTIIFDDKVFSVLNTSVDETFVDNNIHMFPNPADQLIYIDNKLGGNAEYEVKVFDQTGRLVFSKHYNSSRATIDTRTFIDGYYRVQLISGPNVYGQGLIIQH